LDDEFRRIRWVIKRFPYVAIDTEFPRGGVMAHPIGHFRSDKDYAYESLRTNVDMLTLIQLGLTFMDDKGELGGVWQFNFKFHLREETYMEDSIQLLTKAGGPKEGIDPFDFGDLLMSSGVVLNEDVKWLSFHSG